MVSTIQIINDIVTGHRRFQDAVKEFKGGEKGLFHAAALKAVIDAELVAPNLAEKVRLHSLAEELRCNGVSVIAVHFSQD